MALFGAFAAAAATGGARADEKKYGPGVSDSEIKIGQTIAYSGPASSFGTIGRTISAYYRMINDRGGVNGRKITFISADDGYNPARTVEQTRRLVEQEQVLAIFGSLGSPTNASVQRYLNDRKVPQLFLFTGASRFRDPEKYPWTMGGDLSFVNETRAFARFVLQSAPNPKIAILYQNDDFGKDHINGFKAGLGDKADQMIVMTASYEATDPTVDSQVVALKASGADVLLDVSIPKFAAQAIRRVYDIGWHPLHLISYPASSVPVTLQPAGLEKAAGLVTAQFLKEPADPAWKDDAEVRDYLAFARKYNPEVDPNDWGSVIGYYHAGAVVQLLAACGDDLTREHLMDRATHLQGMAVPMLLPGITMTTSPTDYSPIKQMQLQRFDGARWVSFGGVVEG
ncbi:MAG: ABC transporter substrate-binding protein [Alphaproteobacteria bacterium]|nr:ABC transporter substrate-binding protein [Alphaproteobacteria bacterium]MBV9863456.1 ABC transporter substrate-binding protein [Alphaproteobacteria bacterium]